ncbi:hypothetical protein GCM10010219_35860 [Streptomyces netropsis]|nr:hypothetical protein GCM10010219_35860 [Streptomyces netropsis]
MRCTDVMAARSCVPCGPDRSILPLSGWAPIPGARRARPAPNAAPAAWEGSRYGPPPLCCGRIGRGGADTEVDAAYMGGTDPFVCRRVAAHPGLRGGCTLGNALRSPGAGVARSYITPDRRWHTIWRTLAKPGEYSLGP